MKLSDKIAEIKEKIAQLASKMEQLRLENKLLIEENRVLRIKTHQDAETLADVKHQLAVLEEQISIQSPKVVIEEEE